MLNARIIEVAKRGEWAMDDLGCVVGPKREAKRKCEYGFAMRYAHDFLSECAILDGAETFDRLDGQMTTFLRAGAHFGLDEMDAEDIYYASEGDEGEIRDAILEATGLA